MRAGALGGKSRRDKKSPRRQRRPVVGSTAPPLSAMTFQRSILWLSLACAFAVSETGAQAYPYPGRRRPIGRSDRGPYRYERPLVSPWVGADFGFGLLSHQCEDCDDVRSGLALFAGISAGATLYSRWTIAAERIGTRAGSASGAQLTMLTVRGSLPHGLAAKVGFGEGRLKYRSILVVDGRPTWMIGAEGCGLDRVDGCAFLDYSRSGLGSTTTYNAVNVRHRMVATRVGVALRLHLRRGTRIPLPPR